VASIQINSPASGTSFPPGDNNVTVNVSWDAQNFDGNLRISCTGAADLLNVAASEENRSIPATIPSSQNITVTLSDDSGPLASAAVFVNIQQPQALPGIIVPPGRGDSRLDNNRFVCGNVKDQVRVIAASYKFEPAGKKTCKHGDKLMLTAYNQIANDFRQCEVRLNAAGTRWEATVTSPTHTHIQVWFIDKDSKLLGTASAALKDVAREAACF
jgi:hypothetical protein